MTKRLLVAYASKHGSTAEVAQAIARTISEAHIDVDVMPAGSVLALEGYDAVIVGSCVYMGGWHEDALSFLKRFEPELKARDTWLFSSGPTGGTKDADVLVAAATAGPTTFPMPKKVEERARRLGVKGHATFPGKIGDGMTGLLERWLPKGDWRDFGVISNWAGSIAVTLSRPAEVLVG